MTSNSRQILESRNVFIDTSEFERLSFAFNSGLLKILLEHKQINFVLAEVVVSEVRRHLREAAVESERSHRSFYDKARVLRNLGGNAFSALFERFDDAAVVAVFESALDDFLRDASVTIVAIATVDLHDVFLRYCSSKPPFETGRKKSEFPDAFALDSVRRWAVNNATTLYVISRDHGMREYCAEFAELSYVESVEQFLDMAVRQDEDAAERIKAIIESDREVFEERLNEDFPYMGFYIDDREGDVEGVSVTRTDVNDFLIVELKDGIATVELYVGVSFTAEVSYDDVEHGIWDSETKCLLTQREKGEWEREFNGTVRVRIRIDPRNPKSFSIEEFEINNGEDVRVVYDDEWPYK